LVAAHAMLARDDSEALCGVAIWLCGRGSAPAARYTWCARPHVEDMATLASSPPTRVVMARPPCIMMMC